MDNTFKKVAFITICSLTFCLNIVAQDTSLVNDKNDKINLTSGLSIKQKERLKANIEQRKAANKKFKATFSAEQNAIMDNKAISLKDRIEKLLPTLSPEQKILWKNNKNEAKKNSTVFKETLSPEQKSELKKKSVHWTERKKYKKEENTIDTL